MEKEPWNIKLFTPLSASFYPDEQEDEEFYDPEYHEPMTGTDLIQYEEAIAEAVAEHNDMGDGRVCNLMDYYDQNAEIKRKVERAEVSVESHDGMLWGCATLVMKDGLEGEELKEIMEYLTGQYSDGWGEGFEQREISVDGGSLYVHFWQSEDFRVQEMQVQEEQETEAPTKAQGVKKRPRLKLLGHDGNIFSILGDARRLLVRNGQKKEAEEMFRRVEESGSYYQALGIINEYVETELSEPKEKPQRADRARKNREPER